MVYRDCKQAADETENNEADDDLDVDVVLSAELDNDDRDLTDDEVLNQDGSRNINSEPLDPVSQRAFLAHQVGLSVLALLLNFVYWGHQHQSSCHLFSLTWQPLNSLWYVKTWCSKCAAFTDRVWAWHFKIISSQDSQTGFKVGLFPEKEGIGTNRCE